MRCQGLLHLPSGLDDFLTGIAGVACEARLQGNHLCLVLIVEMTKP